MKISFVGGNQEGKYVQVSSSLAINWQPISFKENEQTVSNVVAYASPGLTSIAAVTNAHCARAGASIYDSTKKTYRFFTVIDNYLYERDGGTLSSRGQISPDTTSKARVYLLGTYLNQMFVGESGSNIAYIYDLDANTLTQISDPDFPGLDTAAYMDGYIIVTKNGYCYFSSPTNISDWDGSDVLQPTFKADFLKQVVCFKEELYLFGSEQISIYIEDPDTTFARMPRSTLSYGAASKYAAAVYFGGIFFPGTSNSKDSTGGLGVYLMDAGYNISKVSTKHIDEQLSKVNSMENAWGFIDYSRTGTPLYFLTVPDLETTFVYDIISNQWSLRKSKRPYDEADGTPRQSFYRAYWIAQHNGETMVGDYYTGQILKVDDTNMFEDGQIITRKMRCGVQEVENQWASFSHCQLITNTGVGTLSGQGATPQITFRYSRDGGKSFTTPRDVALSTNSQYENRHILGTVLGTGRRWVFDVTLTDPVDVAIIGMTVRGTAGGKDLDGGSERK